MDTVQIAAPTNNLPKDTLNKLGASLAKQRDEAKTEQPPAPTAPAIPVKPAAENSPAPDAKAKTEEQPATEEPPQFSSEIDFPEELKQEEKPEKKTKKEKAPAKTQGEKATEPAKPTQEFSNEQIDEFDAILGIEKEKPAEKTPAPEEETAPAKPAKTKARTKEERAAVKEEQQKEDAVLADPIYQAVKNFREKGGKTLGEFANQYAAPNYATMSNRDIKKIQLENEGITGDDLEAELDEFDTLSPAKQKIDTNPTRKSLIKDAEDKANTLISTVDDKAVAEFQKLQVEQAKVFTQSLGEMLEDASDRGYYGYVLDDEQLEEVKEYAMNHAVIAADGKSYDVKASFHQAMRNNESVFKSMLKKAHDIGMFKGYDKFMKERNRINRNDFPTDARVPDNKPSFNSYMDSKAIVKPANSN